MNLDKARPPYTSNSLLVAYAIGLKMLHNSFIAICNNRSKFESDRQSWGRYTKNVTSYILRSLLLCDVACYSYILLTEKSNELHITRYSEGCN